MKVIRYNSEWEALVDFMITIDSTTTSPMGKSFLIPKGTILKWEDDAPNGNVWFNFVVNGDKRRGKIESGVITNVIKSGRIKLFKEGNGFVAYGEEYLKKLLK